ncbi:hypothetical protein [Serinicoccus profundi]|uniref:hypothetical protein n=1 Tax=Serinicoccus profundi TaxID=1078471 RepID=UPI000255E328|nr:hypothetical protein [Serinicoccus profundi]
MEELSAQEALRAAVDAVYAVAPADFVATRKEWVGRARAAGHRDTAKEIGGLRKPSVSAAAVNALVRAEDPVLDRLRDVGTRLRHAQSAMDAARMTEMRGERDAVLADWVAAARRHAPGPLAASTEAEVRDTAVAALADARASDIVLSGSLTRALAYSGFGEVDVADAVARTSTGVVLTRIEGGAARGRSKAGKDAAAVSTTDAESRTRAGSAAGEDAGEGGKGSRSAENSAAGGEDEAEDASGGRHEVHDEASEHGDAAEPDDTSEVGSRDAHEAEVERLREELESAEAQVSTAREARRETEAVARRRQDDVDIAAAGVEQARRLLAQAERHAATAQDRLDQAQAEQDEADRTLEDARSARDTGRRQLEEAQDAG